MIAAKSSIKHTKDTILISIPAGRTLKVDDEITVFSSGFTSATGTFIVKCETTDGSEYEFDSSTFLTDGTKLRTAIPFRTALDGLHSGIYIVGGKKVSKK